MLFAALLVGKVIFLLETLYLRVHLVAAERGKDASLGAQEKAADVTRTKQLRWLVIWSSSHRFVADCSRTFVKIPGVPHPKSWATVIIFCKLWTYPTLVTSVLGYVFFQYWWIVNAATHDPSNLLGDLLFWTVE